MPVKGKTVNGDLGGKLTPGEFGQTTLWQMLHLYGMGPDFEKKPFDPRAACFESCRKQGMTEFEAYCRWVDEVGPSWEQAANERKR